MEGGMTLSEDEVGEISAGMFEEFCLEPLNRLSRRYGGIGIHCCANARHQYEHFAKVEGLRLVNFIQPPDVTKQAYALFAQKAAQMHQWCGDGAPSMQWRDHFPDDARVVLTCNADTREEALERLKILREIEAVRANEPGSPVPAL
jgi:hypothetical protein